MPSVVHRIRGGVGGGAGPGRAAVGAVLGLTAATAVALEHGFGEPVLPRVLLRVLQLGLAWGALAARGDVSWRVPGARRWRGRLGAIGEGVVGLGAVGEVVGMPAAGESAAVAVAVAAAVRLNGVLARTMRNPSLLFPASFVVLIAISSVLLKLPAATPEGRAIGWVDAVFTATSAVCVTGLVVRDTGSGFTLFGQAVVLGSIQLGGFGVMIFGSTLALLFGARMSRKEHVTLSAALAEYPAHRISRFVWFIVLSTLVVELAGALVLYALWPADAARGLERAWWSVFHSVSAFCNAGFDVTGRSMIVARQSAAPYVGILPLIVLGGLGFMVLEDVFRCARWRRGWRARGEGRPARLTTHTRLVLATTVWLLAGGFLTILVAQAVEGGGFSWRQLTDAAFMSATARTAGFTTVPMEELSSGSRFALMVLMLVGGSPGSTAGGMKTVVFALLVLAIVSTVRGRAEVEAFGRALPDGLVKKAATIAAGLFGTVTLAVLVLDLTEEIAFEPLLFEVISAATTTGLSLGATEDLSETGRVVIAAVMFLGRVGALSLAAALVGFGSRNGRYALPRDSVSLG